MFKELFLKQRSPLLKFLETLSSTFYCLLINFSHRNEQEMYFFLDVNNFDAKNFVLKRTVKKKK